MKLSANLGLPYSNYMAGGEFYNGMCHVELTPCRHLAMGTCCHYAILWVVRLENGDKYRMTWKIFPWLERIDVKEE